MSHAPEFTTTSEVEAHDRWFRAQVQASLDDEDECTDHDQVMADMERLIAETEARLLNKSA
ncbi:hypothetical protein [Hydrogenophaga atypica]|uniref:Stability determinant domain-containing protein n=1 Tax=Hydrogenophaga atypica TaxID=249409 RepID=A0ABW2QK66_9BURK